MAGAFLYNNRVRQNVSVATIGALASAGVSNLLDPQPGVQARWQSSSAAVLVDFGGPRPIDCVFIGRTSLGIFGSLIVYRVRLSNSDPTGAAGEIWDTGSTAATTGPDYLGNIVVLRSSTVSARYMLVELVDGSASRVDWGILAAGALWRMSRAQSYGFTEGRLIGDTRDRNAQTGAEFPNPAVANPRYTVFQTALLTKSEGAGDLRSIVTGGAVRDVLWIPDTGLPASEINARSLWGAIARPGDEAGASRVAYPGWTRAWRMVERV